MMNLKLLPQYQVWEVPTAEIYVEPLFNCREGIPISTVQDLARSIESRGLDIPIVVQPRKDVPTLPDSYNYRLIVGFRRFTACTKVLHWLTVPGIIRKGLSEEEARIANLSENIDRKELNILEEARGIAGLYPDGTAYKKVAEALRRSPRWVALRYMLLRLPIEVQEAAANNLITQTDIQLIYSAPNHLEIFYQIVSKKYTSSTPKKRIPKPGVPTVEEIHERLCLLVNNGINGLLARVLLWVEGMSVTTAELDAEIQTVLQKLNTKGFLLIEDIIGGNNVSNT